MMTSPAESKAPANYTVRNLTLLDYQLYSSDTNPMLLLS